MPRRPVNCIDKQPHYIQHCIRMPYLRTIPLTGAALEKYYEKQAFQLQDDEEDQRRADHQHHALHAPQDHQEVCDREVIAANNIRNMNSKGAGTAGPTSNNAGVFNKSKSFIKQDSLCPPHFVASGSSFFSSGSDYGVKGNLLYNSTEFSKVLSRINIPEEQEDAAESLIVKQEETVPTSITNEVGNIIYNTAKETIGISHKQVSSSTSQYEHHQFRDCSLTGAQHKQFAQNIPSPTARKSRMPQKNVTFGARLADLIAYKAKHGDCKVPRGGETDSLARWCSYVRSSRIKIENNEHPTHKLSDGNIKTLTEMGFIWGSTRISTKPVKFEDRMKVLRAYKEKHGHCDVRRGEGVDALAKWCSHVRVSKIRIDMNEHPHNKLSEENINCLTEMGFKWVAARQKVSASQAAKVSTTTPGHPR